MKTTIIFSAGLMLIMSLSIVPIIVQVQAEKIYRTWNGDELTHDEYIYRNIQCQKMILHNIIPYGIDCKEWVLTENGESVVIDYVIDQAINN